MTQSELINRLEGMGFTATHISRTAYCLSLAKWEHTLLIQVRKTAPYGVDFKITPDGLYSPDWNVNHYNSSNIDVHSYILRIARDFIDHRPAPVTHNQYDTYDNDYSYYDFDDNFDTEEDSLSDLYDYLSDGSDCHNGEAVYLSDGVWLGSGGGIYDRGR